MRPGREYVTEAGAIFAAADSARLPDWTNAREKRQAPADEQHAGRCAEPANIGQRSFQQHERGKRRDPEHVHHAEYEQQQHRYPATAQAKEAVAQPHDPCAEEARAPFGDEERHRRAKRRAGAVVWFSFAALCEGPRSQVDYLELARRFAVVIVSDVPRLSPDMGNAARRFTWLVDVLYDHRVKLLLSAAVPAAELYLMGPNSHEFTRTVSRLVEMRTREYRS